MTKKKRAKYTLFRPRVYTRHPSHSNLRPRYKNLPLIPHKSCIRLGSITDRADTVSNGGNRIEVNPIQGVQNSEDKEVMKAIFERNEIPTPHCFYYVDGLFEGNNATIDDVENLPYPIIAKRKRGSRGRGLYKADGPEDMRNILGRINPDNYIFEEYQNYAREYRLHVTRNGYFYTCRKMLKQDAEVRWYRNDENCVWYKEDNPSFHKPSNWDEIERACVNALNAVGLDIGACDVKVTSGTDENDNHGFTILEINSAPSFGEITEQKYMEVLPDLIRQKAE